MKSPRHYLARMSGLEGKRKLHAGVLSTEKTCSFKTDDDGCIPRLLGAFPELTISTKTQLLSVQKTDGACPELHTCKNLAGHADRNSLSFYGQEDGCFKEATFCFSVDIACDDLKWYVLEKDPVVVRVADPKTKTVNTLNLDLEAIKDPVCLECGPENKLYISTKRKIFAVDMKSGTCRELAPDVNLSHINKLCMNHKQRSLCVGDEGRVKFLSLEHRPETKLEEVALWKEDEKGARITGLQCDRDGTVYATRETSDEIVTIYTNKESKVQRVMNAENGIQDIALTGRGDLFCLTRENVGAQTGKAKYNVLRVTDGMSEPTYISDRDLRTKRRMLESRIAHSMRQQRLEELERDLLEGSCSVELQDDASGAKTKVKVNLWKLGGAFDYFGAFQRFTGNGENVRLEMSEKVFRDMLEFCYTGTLQQKRHEMHDPQFLLPRLAAANMLGGKLMLESLEQAFVEKVTHKNALEMLALAETLPVQSLVERMQEYVEANAKEIACTGGGAHAEKLSHQSLLIWSSACARAFARSV